MFRDVFHIQENGIGHYFKRDLEVKNMLSKKEFSMELSIHNNGE